tara:strand:- start:1538 stop:3325 length:1788 start_codon:yes stop_codon:yes gene_type:complete
MIKIGLIGYGYWGKILLPKLKTFGKIEFICTSKDTYEDKLKNVNWVVIATPSQTHYEIVKKCLNAGVNVFCEKSLTLDYSQSLELYGIAEQNNVKLYVNDVFMFRKQIKDLKESIELTETFDVIWLKKGRSDYGNFIMSNLYNLAWHDFYILHSIIGDKFYDIESKETKDYLNFSLNIEDKKINFLYDRLRNENKHSINNINLMHDGDDVDALTLMFDYVFNNNDYSDNKSGCLFAAKLIDDLKEKLFTNINVVGGGIFGVTCAWILSKNGYFVTLYEKGDDIINSASAINQYRLHRGYHYPRSDKTALSSKKGEKSFLKYYSDSILKDVENYYCLAKDDSFVSKEEYITFLDRIGLEYEEKNLDLINEDTIQYCVKVRESLFNHTKLREMCWNFLGMYNVRVNLNTEFTKDNLISDKTLTINATYSNKNYLSNHKEDLQFEVCEKPVVKLPKKYRNKSIVIMDGPFMCIDPYGDTEYHVMGNVVHAIHDSNISEFPAATESFSDLINNGIIKKPVITKIDKFIETGKVFFKDFESIDHIGSMYTFRTVLPDREHDDARPTLYKFENDNLISIFSGKIGTCVDVAEDIVRGLKNE